MRTELDRIRFIEAMSEAERQQRLTAFLGAHPEVGVLSSGSMYRVINGQQVPVMDSEIDFWGYKNEGVTHD